jgi:hypothetical protein
MKSNKKFGAINHIFLNQVFEIHYYIKKVKKFITL